MVDQIIPQKVKVHTVYKTQDGTRVPSVTTVLGILAKPALLDWAWKMGQQGLDYKAVRDQAGSVGTLTHLLIESEIKGIKPDLIEYSPADIEKAETGFLNWLDWLKGHDVETIQAEIPQVSETHKFGGTIDWIIRHLGDLWLVDFKTSKALYDEHIYQVASYKMLWEENNPSPPISQVHILRIDKETGGFEDRLISPNQLEIGGQIFLACLEIYNKIKVLKA